MKKLFVLLAALGLVAAACGDDAGEDITVSELNVAYFAGWPLPPQIGQADGSFAEAVGVDSINWIPLNSGGEMAEAMLAGDVDIAYSMGLTPFANNVNSGAELSLVGIAVSYAEADNCIVQGSLGVTRDNAAEVLAGTTVVTPIGNVTHFKMLNMMDFLGVDIGGLNIVPAEGGASTAAAFQSGDIDVGCAFGGSIVDMTDAGGVPLMTGAEVESEVGIRTYDITAIPTSFGEENPGVVTAFLRATEEFTQTWRDDPDANNPIIATAAGMEDVGNFLAGDVWFQFPTIDEQLSSDWMGGNVSDVMKDQVEFFMEQGQVETVLGDFAPFVDTSFLEAAK